MENEVKEGNIEELIKNDENKDLEIKKIEPECIFDDKKTNEKIEKHSDDKSIEKIKNNELNEKEGQEKEENRKEKDINSNIVNGKDNNEANIINSNKESDINNNNKIKENDPVKLNLENDFSSGEGKYNGNLPEITETNDLEYDFDVDDDNFDIYKKDINEKKDEKKLINEEKITSIQLEQKIKEDIENKKNQENSKNNNFNKSEKTLDKNEKTLSKNEKTLKKSLKDSTDLSKSMVNIHFKRNFNENESKEPKKLENNNKIIKSTTIGKEKGKEIKTLKTSKSMAQMDFKNINLKNKKEEDKNIKKEKAKPKKKINEPKLSLPLFPNQKDKETFLDSAIKKLLSSSNVLQNEMKILMDILYQNNSDTKRHFSYNFLIKLKKVLNDKVAFLQNYDNFNNFSYIFVDMSLKEDKSYILNLILEISQLIKYENNYLYKKIEKKNKIFKKTNFWKKLIEQSFIDLLNEHTNRLIMEENKKNKKTHQKSQSKTSFWKRFTTDSFINAFNDLTNNIMEKDEEENITPGEDIYYLLEFTGYSRYITDYKKLNSKLKKDLEEFGKKNLDIILCKNIITMSKFNVGKDMMIVLIFDFCAQFSFENDLKEYYINLIESYHSINNIYSKQKLSLPTGKNDINSFICILSNVFIFLPPNQRIQLFLLNKKLNWNDSLKNNIFKILLRKKKLPLEKRVLIWENILKIEKFQKEYNYNEIKENTKKRLDAGELKKGTRPFKNNETIDKDVNRTIFLNDTHENQLKLRSLLKCLNLLIPSIGYYQGMSYIGAFLLQVLNYDEEKTFYFMLSIETETKYKELFKDDLKLLSINFKVLEKVLDIGLPEVEKHLKHNRIMATYYSPSWFLTIFCCFSSFFEIKNLPQFTVMVFEKFILEGWNAIFNGGFTAIQYYYRELLNVHEDSIMNYLITDFCDKEIFKNKDFDNIEYNYAKNAEFINEDLFALLQKICNYEEQNKNDEEF